MMDNILKKLMLAAFFCLLISLPSQAENIKTPAEETNFTQYSQNEEITQFLCRVDNASKEIAIQIIGKTLQVKNYGAKELYLCILTKEGIASPQNLDRRKPTLLFIASQHGSEQSAKEAILQIIRDVVFGELRILLEKVNLLIIPQANPYGNWMDQRRNEQDLDLNRDHVKLESPEAEAIHRVFRTWMPEVTMDIHEKGEYYYKVAIGCVSNPNIDPALLEFSRDVILKDVEDELKKKDIAFQEYMPTQVMGFDPSAGVNYLPEGSEEKEDMRRYSTTDLNDGRNSLGIYETLSFIQEVASRRDIKALKNRTNWQYWSIRAFIESVGKHKDEVLSLVRRLRKNLIEKAGVYSEEDEVHLKMQYIRSDEEPVLEIKKLEHTENSIIGVLRSDKKAGDIIFSADLDTYSYPSDEKEVIGRIDNWFPGVKPTMSVQRPLGYIISAQHQDVIETLLRHCVGVDTFTKDVIVQVEAYEVSEIMSSEEDYDPPQRIEVQKKVLKPIVNKGDFYISCAQEGANLIPCLLEPQSLYGFIRYWKYNLVPDSGDIFPFYRVVLDMELPLMPYKRWKR